MATTIIATGLFWVVLFSMGQLGMSAKDETKRSPGLNWQFVRAGKRAGAVDWDHVRLGKRPSFNWNHIRPGKRTEEPMKRGPLDFDYLRPGKRASPDWSYVRPGRKGLEWSHIRPGKRQGDAHDVHERFFNPRPLGWGKKKAIPDWEDEGLWEKRKT